VTQLEPAIDFLLSIENLYLTTLILKILTMEEDFSYGQNFSSCKENLLSTVTLFIAYSQQYTFTSFSLTRYLLLLQAFRFLYSNLSFSWYFYRLTTTQSKLLLSYTSTSNRVLLVRFYITFQ
jgi:hypothetical protein